jgi:cathepsin B
MVGLMVYEDLYNYESGVYEYTTGKLAGGHAIRALGWGHDDDGHLYWIC